MSQPQQPRSERTQERLLRAAEKLILEKGLADASVPEIARRAGSSVGGFYARFPDKGALLRALEERFFDEMLVRVAKLADAGRWGAAPIATIARACADELVSVFRERRNLIAAFLHRASADPELLAEAIRFRATTAERIATLLLPRRARAAPSRAAPRHRPRRAIRLRAHAPARRGRRRPRRRPRARRWRAGGRDHAQLSLLHRCAPTWRPLVKYVQRNPVPVPVTGAFGSVQTTLDAVFDWEYALKRQNLLALFEKGKALNWNANELDWSTDVDMERIMRERIGGNSGMMNQLLNPPRPLSPDESTTLQIHMNSFMLSQFLHGEQGALLATAKIVETVPWAEAKFYAASQVLDEARHVEVYHRYLTEKLGLSYGVHPSLQTLLDDILRDPRWDLTFLGMQILVEGLALAAFGLLRLQMAGEPLIQDITTRIMADESRHVAFGVLALEDVYTKQMEAHELREREDFVIEASHLLRERLLMQPVFERLGWDVPLWVDWAQRTPFMVGFRQMTFAKIVPNLKRLGLLTPRVREAYAKMDLLRFENEKDSVEEPEAKPPAELVQLLLQLLSGAQQPAAPAA